MSPSACQQVKKWNIDIVHLSQDRVFSCQDGNKCLGSIKGRPFVGSSRERERDCCMGLIVMPRRTHRTGRPACKTPRHKVKRLLCYLPRTWGGLHLKLTLIKFCSQLPFASRFLLSAVYNTKFSIKRGRLCQIDPNTYLCVNSKQFRVELMCIIEIKVLKYLRTITVALLLDVTRPPKYLQLWTSLNGNGTS
jgi:hypothetical protein